MAPVLSEGYTSPPPLPSVSPLYSRDLSNTSVHSFAGVLISNSSAVYGRATGTTSTQDGGVSRDETLRHAGITLDARQYQKRPFALRLLALIRKLRIAVWCNAQLSPEDLEIHRVSGALTNAVFFVSCKTIPSAETLLLRVYGPSTGSLLSRTRELQTLHTISTQYNIGPRIYGTFENGRIEEYFHSTALTASEIRDPQISGWIAARMAELHSVNVTIIDKFAFEGLNTRALDDLGPYARRFEIARNVKSWFDPAQKVLALPGVSESLRSELDLPKFWSEWDKYLSWMLDRPKTFGMRRVFAHNDTQYGNLLRLKGGPEGVDQHKQIVVVDFEYAAANAAAYDIANHFNEWTANYHSPFPHKFSPAKYPTPLERRNFYASYITHSATLPDFNTGDNNKVALSNLMEELDGDVEAWVPASHASAALWGIVQGRENILAGVIQPDFDYISYARARMDSFRLGLKNFGIVAHH